MEGHVNQSFHVDIVELFHSVVDLGIPHCRICYRTSKEIKLVRPNKLLQFLGYLKQQALFGPSALDKSACVICEGAAATAMRLTDAILNAVHVKDIMVSYSQGGQALKGKKMSIFTRAHHVNPCNDKLNAYRDRTTYKQTEVLIVDSLGLEWAQGEKDKAPIRVDMPIVVRDDPPTIETVVLDDDDETTKTQVPNTAKDKAPTAPKTDKRNSVFVIQNPPHIPQLVPITFLLNQAVEKSKYAALVPNKMQIITGHATLVDNFVLHEIVMQNGSLTVPGLGCEIKDGHLIYNPKLFEKYQLVVPNGTAKPTTSVNTSQTSNTASQTDSLLRTRLSKSTSDVEARGFKTLPSNQNVTASSETVLRHKNASKVNVQVKNGRFLSTQSLNNTKFDANSTGLDNVSIIDVKGAIDENESCTIEMVEVDDILKKHIDKKEGNNRTDSKKPRKELVINMNINNNCSIKESGDVIAVVGDVISQRTPSMNETQETVQTVQEGAEKRPIEKRSRIDWEDKIPMDVISFMDATDPNAELIVPDQLPTQPPEIVDIKDEEDVVIDLC